MIKKALVKGYCGIYRHRALILFRGNFNRNDSSQLGGASRILEKYAVIWVVEIWYLKKICISLTELFASSNCTSLLSEMPITNRRERGLPTNKTDYGDFLKVETHTRMLALITVYRHIPILWRCVMLTSDTSEINVLGFLDFLVWRGQGSLLLSLMLLGICL